jgi:hypothetical protein
MDVNKIQIMQNGFVDKQITIPVQLSWDYLGLDQSIDEYESKIITEVIGVGRDFEVTRFAHAPLTGTTTEPTDIKYEFNFYQKNAALTYSGFAKYELFNNEWGEIYLNARPYTDTYFSVVTETVFDYPYSFRTEKIWKPVAIGHPFIVAGNAGYYRDLHQLGFQTFGHVIDESFDLIENNQDRLNRISQVVTDLCQQDLASFIKECYNVCKYNQQHLAELGPKIRAEFPKQLEQYVNERS